MNTIMNGSFFSLIFFSVLNFQMEQEMKEEGKNMIDNFCKAFHWTEKGGDYCGNCFFFFLVDTNSIKDIITLVLSYRMHNIQCALSIGHCKIPSIEPAMSELYKKIYLSFSAIQCPVRCRFFTIIFTSFETPDRNWKSSKQILLTETTTQKD